MLLNWALLIGLARGQIDFTSFYGSNITELLQSDLVDLDELSEVLGDEKFQMFTIYDGLDIIGDLQDADTCSIMVNDLFESFWEAFDEEYEGTYGAYDESAGSSILYAIANSLEDSDTTSISHLGSMIKSILENTYFANWINFWIDNDDIYNVNEVIQTIKTYGIQTFCQDIKNFNQFDDNEYAVDILNELIADNTDDYTYISIGANLNAAFNILRKIVDDGDYDLLERLMNPDGSANTIVQEISWLIEGDIDAMNAFKVLSGHAQIVISILRDIVIEEIDLDDTVFSEIGEIAEEWAEDLVDDFTTDYVADTSVINPITNYSYNSYEERYVSYEEMEEIDAITSTLKYIQSSFLSALTTGIDAIAQHPVFTDGNVLIPECDYDFDECVSALSDELIENIEEIRIAVFCGTYPVIDETCEEWYADQSEDYSEDYSEKEGYYVESDVEYVEDYPELFTDSPRSPAATLFPTELPDEYEESIEKELEYEYEQEMEYNQKITEEEYEEIKAELEEQFDYEYGTHNDYESDYSSKSFLEQVEDELLGDRYIITVAVGTIVLFLFIITIMGIIALCRRNRFKYDKLENEASYPTLDKRFENV